MATIPILWLTIIALMLYIARAEVALAVGPSFDCNQFHTPTATLICSSPDLSRIDLEFVQAYYALRQEVGEAGWPVLRQEDVYFIQSVIDQCGLLDLGPLSGDKKASAVACLKQLYQKQRQTWLARLHGAAAEEANRPIDIHVVLQRRLQVLGFLSASEGIDGVYGAATRAAIMAWQRSKGLPETGLIDNVAAAGLGVAPPSGANTQADKGGATHQAEKSSAGGDNQSLSGPILGALKSIAQGLFDLSHVDSTGDNAGDSAYQKGDYATALKIFSPLATRGDAYAQFHIGLIYFNGQGVAQDYDEAFKWFKMAADQGDADGQNAVGVIYERRKDKPNAIKWFITAVEQGDTEAMANAGYLLVGHLQDVSTLGMFADKNDVRSTFQIAYMLFNMASALGNIDAVKERDELVAWWTGDWGGSASVIEEAQRMARQCIQGHFKNCFHP